MSLIRVGTAGWATPRAVADRFPEEGSGLQRYAARLAAAEINTTFYRAHKPETFARWREDTPHGFRFAVKLARTLTHEARLAETGEPLAAFVAQVSELGDKRGPLLVQLPPSLALDLAVADRFFAAARRLWTGPIACEPRHATWFEDEGEALLTAHRVARVAADPARHPSAGVPGGWRGLHYWRLHGSPRVYFTPYPEDALRRLARSLKESEAQEAWCMFDNTASGAAAANALDLQALL